MLQDSHLTLLNICITEEEKTTLVGKKWQLHIYSLHCEYNKQNLTTEMKQCTKVAFRLSFVPL